MNAPWHASIRVLILLVLAAGLVELWPLPPVRAGDQVVTNGNDSGPGSLRQAINDVHAGGTIAFDLPAYVVGIVLTSGELVISKSMTIKGPGAQELFVSGNNSSRVFHISSGTVTISGLTISGGEERAAFAKGGGIANYGTLTLREVIIKSNLASGAIEMQGSGVLTLEATHLTNNLAVAGGGTWPGDAHGGAVYLWETAEMTVIGGAFTGNGAYAGDGQIQDAGTADGGAIYNEGNATLVYGARWQ